MPMFTVPSSFGTLRESNDCHEPAGQPTGGQFCSKTGWHLTDNPRFTPDPARKPTLNRVFLSDLMADPKDLPSGLFVTDKPEYWMQAHGYERPYVAEVRGVPSRAAAGGARVDREDFLQGDVKVLRVMTVDEYAREKYGERGWVEDFHDERPWSEQVKTRKLPKGYKARTVDQMTPAEIADWERKFKAWARRPEGPRGQRLRDLKVRRKKAA